MSIKASNSYVSVSGVSYRSVTDPAGLFNYIGTVTLKGSSSYGSNKYTDLTGVSTNPRGMSSWSDKVQVTLSSLPYYKIDWDLSTSSGNGVMLTVTNIGNRMPTGKSIRMVFGFETVDGTGRMTSKVRRSSLLYFDGGPSVTALFPDVIIPDGGYVIATPLSVALFESNGTTPISDSVIFDFWGSKYLDYKGAYLF